MTTKPKDEPKAKTQADLTPAQRAKALAFSQTPEPETKEDEDDG